MFEKYLEDLGLSEKEAKVYLSLLQVDNDSVLDLAEKTKINRTTIYPVLESLSKKGLISEVKVDKKVRFQAEPPERLETYVERQKIVLEEHAKRLKDMIPQLKSVQRETGERPVVKLYEGKEGILSMTEDLFSGDEKGGVMYMLYPKDLLEEIFKDHETNKFKKFRLDKKIQGQSIYTYSKGAVDSTSNNGNRVRIDSEKYPILCDITVYNSKVRIAILGETLSGVVIQSKDVAQTFVSLFKLAFAQAKKDEGPQQ